METSPRFADIAVDGAPADLGTFTYGIPESLRDQVVVGSVVWVPLRKHFALGVVLAVHAEEPAEFEVRPIAALTEPAVVVREDRLAVATWMARETAASRFSCIEPFLPPGLRQRTVETVRLVNPLAAVGGLTPAQRRVVELLGERGTLPIETVRTILKSSLTSVIPTLEDAGIVERGIRATPHVPSPRVHKVTRLITAPPEGALARAPKQQAIIDVLTQHGRTVGATDAGLVSAILLRRSRSDRTALAALVKKGFVSEAEEPALPPDAEELAEIAIPMLTLAQSAVWEDLERRLATGAPGGVLLHGVTGSGKTEIYLRAIGWCLRQGKGAILLVPEIALATQIVRRVTARFPDRVAVLHSALSERERIENWHAVAQGVLPVVVGPRSALFAPVDDLGVIIVDEEHESAYKQDAEPRYHARAVAEHLAARGGAVAVLGSATPAVETMWRARNGTIGLLELPERVGPNLSGADPTVTGEALALPEVQVVDMRRELQRGTMTLLSGPLTEAVASSLNRGEQAMILLNRRGMSTIVLCRSCGNTLSCPLCDIPLVFHSDRGQLICHRCDERRVPPPRCTECGGELNYFGAGTQRVEAEVRRDFPGARVLRWDQDTVRGSGGHARLLRQVEDHEVDIVVGTQMIAKGLDFPLVTTIGVINADTMLHLPDFRSGERTFQLLTQVAGRAGRRGPGARVVVQSYTPEHYAVQAASRHDYGAFFAEEIDFRRTHRYPPFSRLVRWVVRHADEARAAATADELALVLARHARDRRVEIDIMGPAPAFAARVRGDYQWQVILRSDRLGELLDGLPTRPDWIVDVDPLSML